MEKIQYDTTGRMKFNSDFHENQRKPWTDEDLVYLCKYHEIDGLKTMSMALGRTEGVIVNKLRELQKNEMYDLYKNNQEYYYC